MRWQLRANGAGDGYRKEVAQWLAKRGKAAAGITDEPELFPDLIDTWIAWHELHHGRPLGFAAGGLPWAEMSRHCDDHGIAGPWKLRRIRLLQAMDSEFLRSIRAKE